MTYLDLCTIKQEKNREKLFCIPFIIHNKILILTGTRKMFIPNTIRIKCLFQDHRQVQIGVRFVTLFVIITYTIHTENKKTVPRIDSLSDVR